ncbi:MAG: hypothetical protein LBP40_04985 [Campylobacteraceae bacterium]|jgi:hypothetical protein|nr:hypothetical protein [Campylobacteraceae bacterium]
MDEKDTILLEISSLIESDKNAQSLNLDIMKFMSFEELTSIHENLLKRKERRRVEQEEWYNEWAEKLKC